MAKVKVTHFLSWPRVLALLALLALVFLSLSGPLQAQTVTQGYGTNQVLQRGMIVQLIKTDTTKVEPVKFETMDQMLGVVVNANDAPVTLSSAGQQVFVANTSHFEVLVSDQAGPIATGDYVTMSNVAGIGMKTGDREPLVIGRALAPFDGKTNVVSETTVKNSSGQSQTVHISRIDTDISVSRNPLLKTKEPNLPQVLQRASEAIAGKPVNPIRVYVGLVVFVISCLVAGTLLYSGIRSAIISIGRNPLSKASIIRGMLQVIVTGLIIFISGVFGVYLLLKV